MISYEKIDKGALPPTILLPECFASEGANGEVQPLLDENAEDVGEAATEAGVVAPTATAASVPPPFTNLLILPPLQKRGVKNAPSLEESIAEGAVIALPALRSEEPVASLRAALGELKQYASLTQYRLQLETDIILPEDTQFSPLTYDLTLTIYAN
jgi:hypothetical protein